MAEITNDEDVQEVRQKKANRHDGGVADLERVTDYAEEKEIQFNMSNVSTGEPPLPRLSSYHSGSPPQLICPILIAGRRPDRQ